MTAIMVRSDDWQAGAAVAFGGIVWLFLSDPLPAAIRRGLDAYAKDDRK